MMNSNFKKTTKRLILRPLKPGDYQIWRDTYLNLKKPQNKWDKGPRDPSELTKSKFKIILDTHVKHRLNDYYYDLSVFEKRSGQMIGFSSLMDITRNVFQNAYLGYVVFNHHWRKGFGKEMVKATLDIGFKNLKLHRIEAGIDPYNKRSIALAKSVGLRREGLSKRRLYLNKQWLDMAIYAITAEEKGYKGYTGALTTNRR